MPSWPGGSGFVSMATVRVGEAGLPREPSGPSTSGVGEGVLVFVARRHKPLEGGGAVPALCVCTACPIHSAVSHTVWMDSGEPSTRTCTRNGSASSSANGRMGDTHKGGTCDIPCSVGSEAMSIKTAPVANAWAQARERRVRGADVSTTLHCAIGSM